MTDERFEIQGWFVGIPYDWRRPTWKKLVDRCWDRGGQMIRPHAFGWGWTFNLAHQGTWLLMGGMVVVALLFSSFFSVAPRAF